MDDLGNQIDGFSRFLEVLADPEAFKAKVAELKQAHDDAMAALQEAVEAQHKLQADLDAAQIDLKNAEVARAQIDEVARKSKETTERQAAIERQSADLAAKSLAADQAMQTRENTITANANAQAAREDNLQTREEALKAREDTHAAAVNSFEDRIKQFRAIAG
jgi:uncharacterized protein (DUF3084 family)